MWAPDVGRQLCGLASRRANVAFGSKGPVRGRREQSVAGTRRRIADRLTRSAAAERQVPRWCSRRPPAIREGNTPPTALPSTGLSVSTLRKHTRRSIRRPEAVGRIGAEAPERGPVAAGAQRQAALRAMEVQRRALDRAGSTRRGLARNKWAGGASGRAMASTTNATSRNKPRCAPDATALGDLLRATRLRRAPVWSCLGLWDTCPANAYARRSAKN